MTNYFDQLNRVKGTKFNWSFSLTNSQLVKMTNFKKVATKKYGCFNQSVFTVYKQISKYSAVNKKDVNAHWLDMFFKNVLYLMKI